MRTRHDAATARRYILLYFMHFNDARPTMRDIRSMMASDFGCSFASRTQPAAADIAFLCMKPARATRNTRSVISLRFKMMAIFIGDS